MDICMDSILEYFRGITWEGPAIVVVMFLIIFVVLRQWGIIFIIVITLFLAGLAKNLVIMNDRTDVPVITVSMLVYCTGCGVILLLAISKHLKG